MARRKPRQKRLRFKDAPAAGIGTNRLPRTYLETVVAKLDAGVAVVSPKGDIRYMSPRFAEFLDLRSYRTPGSPNLTRYVSAGSWDSLSAALQKAVREPVKAEMRIVRSKVRSLHLELFPVRWKGRTDIAIIADEVTALSKANQALRESEASISSLSARILQVQDEVQRRIARNLHDVTGQDLATLGISLSQVAKEQQGEAAAEILAQCREVTHKIGEDIRSLSYMLHPPLLDEMGLVSALSSYVEGLRKRGILEASFEATPNLPRLSPEIEINLFRVTQEGLTNVLRHSGSRKADVGLWLESDVVRLSVTDQGKGMAPETSRSKQKPKGFGVGIAGMRERLRQLGGQLEVRFGSGGTEVIGTVPVGRAAEVGERTRDLSTEVSLPDVLSPLPNHNARILIVDDHEVTRKGIRSLLAEAPDLRVCGEAKDGLEAISKTEALDPDLVIMDLSMPGLGGLSASYRIKEMRPNTKILVFTTHEYPTLIRSIRMGGCNGYLAKSDAGEDLIRAVRVVLSGGEFFGSEKALAQPA